MADTLDVLDQASSAQRKTSTMKGDFRRHIIVGIGVAKEAVQRLAAVALVRAQEPADTTDGRYRQLEREMEELNIRMEAIQKDRARLQEEVKILRKELLGYRAPGRKKRGRTGQSSRSSPLGMGVSRVVENIPPARRPALRVATRVLFGDLSMQRIADERGRIVIPTEAQMQGDIDLPDCLPSSGPERSERWKTVSRKRRRRKKRKEDFPDYAI